MATTQIQPNNFDRSKPFYPLVIHFICQLFGFKELAVRSLTPALRQHLQQVDDPVEELRRLQVSADSEPVRQTIERMAHAGGAIELMPPLDLGSNAQGAPIHIEAAEIGSEVAINAEYLAGWLMRAAGSLVIVAWESTEGFHDKGPL